MLYVFERGSGLAIVMIHGYPLNHTIWENQFSLAERYRLIVPDLPGFGQSSLQNNFAIESYADGIVSILDDRKIEQAVILGHSMGGYILLSLAERYSQRLAGLGLICTQAGSDLGEARTNRFKTIERVQSEGLDFIKTSMSEKLLAPDNFKSRPELSQKLKRIIDTASIEGVASALQAMANRKSHEPLLPAITIPALIISGNDDVLVPQEKSEWMANLLPKSQLIKMEGAGHMAMMEKPAEFNKALEEFLKTLH
ncbi:alpha/beta hydrolase [bacterium]|nr:alpha/beta hydrolase [bacterium]